MAVVRTFWRLLFVAALDVANTRGAYYSCDTGDIDLSCSSCVPSQYSPAALLLPTTPTHTNTSRSSPQDASWCIGVVGRRSAAGLY